MENHNKLKLSIIIPAHNEEENIRGTIIQIIPELEKAQIPYELLVVNDNSKDGTLGVLQELAKTHETIRVVNRTPPNGFGRAIRSGLMSFSGDVVMIVMADLSDDPADIVKYYRKIEEGYDCVFGSRFLKTSIVKEYPAIKLLVNRIVNKLLQLLFLTGYNDLTNAFKAYRAEVIHSILPLQASHFNITIEMSLSALIRGYKISQVPINWYGRKWGSSNLSLRSMGRRYLATLIKIWFEKLLIMDDLMTEVVPPKTDGQESTRD
jgi:dolichol-phosphate mannosyltransferase